MKLYAQHGFGPGRKITEGLEAQVIDGFIIGAKDISPTTLQTATTEWLAANPNADFLFDPQYYALQVSQHADNRLGYLVEHGIWDNSRRNESFLRNQTSAKGDIRRALEFQEELGVTHLIAPNIVVNRSLDSREGLISEGLLTMAPEVHMELGFAKPLYCTLAISAEAIGDREEVERLSNNLASLNPKPDGIYLLVSTSGDVTDLYSPRRYGNILFLIFSLKLNGYNVIWGYSDIIGAVAASTGLNASASGWAGTLRNFSLSRFGPPAAGGARPRTKFFSKRLLNRILLGELRSASRFEGSVLNTLPTDSSYFNGGNIIEPEDETSKCLQSWGGLKALQDELESTGDIQTDLENAKNAVENADALYRTLENQAIRFETSTSRRHLQSIIESIEFLQAQL